jgi:hypothetical protein
MTRVFADDRKVDRAAHVEGRVNRPADAASVAERKDERTREVDDV